MTYLLTILIFLSCLADAGQMLNRNAYGVRGLDPAGIVPQPLWRYDFQRGLLDASGNNNTGLVVYAAGLKYATNSFGNIYAYTPNSGGIAAPSSNAYVSATNASYAFWAKELYVSAYRRFMSVGTISGQSNNVTFQSNSGGISLAASVGNSANGQYFYAQILPPSSWATSWQHVLVTFNKTNMSYYTNGVLATTDSVSSGSLNEADFLPTAARSAILSDNTTGIDDVTWWNTTLTPRQALEFFNSLPSTNSLF